MKKQFKVVNTTAPAGAVVFDRAILTYHTMDDAALAQEILSLFVDQLARLETANWTEFDIAFEMHTLRGAAAAVGAMQIEALAEGWRGQGAGLEAATKAAIGQFRKAVKA